MDNLFWMLTIIERHSTEKFIGFYAQYGIDINLVTLARGTANDDVLDILGLDTTEKTIIFNFTTYSNWEKIRSGLRSKMRIDVPGRGIAFIVPVSSVGGRKLLHCMTNGHFEKTGEESVLKDTKHELLVVIAEQGYTDLVMDAARTGGASGGTVLHARGTGMKKAEEFLGVKLANEKELTLIVVNTAIRNECMKAIMEQAGSDTKAKALVFSLPVTDTAGLRLIEDE